MIITDAVSSSSRPACQSPPALVRQPQSTTSSTLVMVVSPDRNPRLATSPSPSHQSLSLPLITGQPAAVNSPRKRLQKPKRPLTAYHIYFQIEREFIIQTMEGEDADRTIHEGKIFFNNVPKRYRDTRLSPDWYFGPGKRAKRKHRKQHGKIGFLELSRVITSRWNKLDETDPEIKQFVSRLADQEMDEFKREMKEYREHLMKNMITPVFVSNRSGVTKKQTAPQAQEEELQQQLVTRRVSHESTSPEVFSFSTFGDRPFFLTNSNQVGHESDRFKNEFHYASTYQQRSFGWGERRPEDDFVDICDDDILSLWKSTNV